MKRISVSLAVLLAWGTSVTFAQSMYSPTTTDASQIGFGAAVAVGTDAVFIGEPFNEVTSGIVYVYRRTAQRTTWGEVARLKATDARPGDRFGTSLSIRGGTLLVGATAADSNRGAVYVFDRGANQRWSQASRLEAADRKGGDLFGGALVLGADLALVSALGRDSLSGAVYVFRRSGGRWTPAGTLTGSDVKRGDRFGSSLALMDGVAFVGAPRHNDQTGAVYVFRQDGAGGWKEEAKIVSRNAARNSSFGASLATRGADLLVGAPQVSSNTGAVYGFSRDTASGEWRQTMALAPFDGGSARFGTSLAWESNEVWIGAPGANGFAGRVYRYTRDTTGEWLGASKLAAANTERGDFFAGTMAVEGNIAVAGVTGDDYGAGTAVIFDRAPGSTTWRERGRVLSEDVGYDPIVGGESRCEGGEIKSFDCNAVDLVAFLPSRQLGAKRGVRLNDIWGWTDSTAGRDYVMVGRLDGTSFVDVTDPANPRYLGDLPKTEGSPGSTWRDMKVYRNHVFIVADGAGNHGMQVFDLTQLRRVRTPQIFKPTAHYTRIASSHNIVINEQTGFAYAVGNSSGGETCGGGLHMINIQDPENPTFAGCFSDKETGRAGTGYSHDAQCVVYHGPDSTYSGHEICMGSNETALSIADVSDKQNPRALARASYPNVGYAHQGWFSEDHRYFFMDDELDELAGTVKGTRTLIWDVRDLDDPVLAKEYIGPTMATDHNLYIKGNRLYQSNYVFGLRVVDITNPIEPKEVGFFDTVPYGENTAGFGGSWSNYPYFKSGVIAVTSGREGLFLVRAREAPVP